MNRCATTFFGRKGSVLLMPSWCSHLRTKATCSGDARNGGIIASGAALEPWAGGGRDGHSSCASHDMRHTVLGDVYPRSSGLSTTGGGAKGLLLLLGGALRASARSCSAWLGLLMRAVGKSQPSDTRDALEARLSGRSFRRSVRVPSFTFRVPVASPSL
eukprot:scaffold8253_cov267-Pinguiococcus_pyrenoidosus.AAC.1